MSALSDRFVEALRGFDTDAMTDLLAPDAVAWLNIGDRNRQAADIVEGLRFERTLLRSSSTRVRHQAMTEDGFVVQLVFDGITRSGTEFHVPICIVARVTDGRIEHFDEYADAASLRPLHQEFITSQQAATELPAQPSSGSA